MVVDIGNPQNCYECLIRNRGYSGDGMKCGKTGSVISWYDGNRQRMTDCPLSSSNPSMDAAIEKVISERMRQIQLWGESSNNHPFEWVSILGEEFGELCEAINETYFKHGTHPERGGQDKIIAEAAQVAAVAIAIIENAMRQQGPLKAYWIIGPGVNPTCSYCKSEVPAILFDGKWSHKFCPNCGTYMKEVKDNE